MEVFTIFEFGVLSAEEPREHLTRLHAGLDHAAAFVPLLRVPALVETVNFQSDLR